MNVGERVTYTRHGRTVSGTVVGHGTDILGPFVRVAVPGAPDMRVRDGDPALKRAA